MTIVALRMRSWIAPFGCTVVPVHANVAGSGGLRGRAGCRELTEEEGVHGERRPLRLGAAHHVLVHDEMMSLFPSVQHVGQREVIETLAQHVGELSGLFGNVRHERSVGRRRDTLQAIIELAQAPHPVLDQAGKEMVRHIMDAHRRVRDEADANLASGNGVPGLDGQRRRRGIAAFGIDLREAR